MLSSRKQKRLDASIGRAVERETREISDSAVDTYFCCVLMSTVSAGGAALSEFVEVVRKESNEPDLDKFVRAIDSGVEVTAAIRVAAWAYVNRVVERRWRKTHDEVLSVAASGMGLLSPWEEQIAALDPTQGTTGDAGMMLRFNRTVYEAVIASVNGEGGQSSTDLPGIMIWSQAFHDNWGHYELMLDHLAPGGTPSD